MYIHILYTGITVIAHGDNDHNVTLVTKSCDTQQRRIHTATYNIAI